MKGNRQMEKKILANVSAKKKEKKKHIPKFSRGSRETFRSAS